VLEIEMRVSVGEAVAEVDVAISVAPVEEVPEGGGALGSAPTESVQVLTS